MADQYLFLIVEPDWDSDAYLGEGASEQIAAEFPEFESFERRVAELGARIVSGNALHNRRHGGTVTPGPAGREVEDAVWTDGASLQGDEVISGYYVIEAESEAIARQLAPLVPTGGHIEWRRVFPMG